MFVERLEAERHVAGQGGVGIAEIADMGAVQNGTAMGRRLPRCMAAPVG